MAAGFLLFGVVALFAATSFSAAVTRPTALAVPHDPTYKCKGNPALSITLANPPISTRPVQVLSLTWKVVNDEDSGFAGYWAIDSYVTSIHVWKLHAGPNAGQFYVWKSYSGQFLVPQGALSPGETGTTPNALVEPTAGYGTMQGGYAAYIAATETFFPRALPVSGSLGIMNYAGTTADLLLGTYGAGQVGVTAAYDWYSTYFTPAAGGDFNYANSGNAWGWVYALNPYFTTSAGSTPSANLWCNFGAGSYGDIVTAG